MIETRLHARLAPSAATRWMACPGSVRLSANVVDSGSNYADNGTACHAVLERVLRTGCNTKSFVGKKIDVGEGDRRTQVEITKEMAGWVEVAVKWVRRYMKKHPGSLLLAEERIVVGRAFGVPDDLWGTSDVVIVNAEELVIADAKFGYNKVSAVDNPQLQCYGIGMAADYGWIHEKYRFVIIQPQCSDVPDEHTVTRDELLDVQRRYAPKIAATQDPDAPLLPSDEACHYCPAAGVCPELHRRSLMLAQREFAAVETLSLDDLGTLLEHKDRIKAGLEAAERHALRLIMLGQKVPGFKAVAGDKRRIWKDEKSAYALMRKLGHDEDDVEPRKMITPAQAEKLVGRKNAAALQVFIDKPKGDPTLVREDDPRESLTPDFTPLGDDSQNAALPSAAGSVDDLM